MSLPKHIALILTQLFCCLVGIAQKTGTGSLNQFHQAIESSSPLHDSVVCHLVPGPAGKNTTINTSSGVQDIQGYMWFATGGGLQRYDGYHYTAYLHNPLDPHSIADNYLRTVYADSKGYIWVGFHYAYGIDRLDPATGIFTHFRHDNKIPNSLGNDLVNGFLEDHTGTIWVATSGGLDRYDANAKHFFHYRHHPDDNTSLSCNLVHTLFEDKAGTLWVGTGSIWEVGDGGLNRFERRSGKFTRYVHDAGNTLSLGNNLVSALYEDSRGTFWVGTAGNALYIMDRKNGTFTKCLYTPAQRSKQSGNFQKVTWPFIANTITFITEDAVGAIWIGTLKNGVSRYDVKTNTARTVSPVYDTSGMLDHARWCCKLRDGVLWIGYWNETF